MASGKSTSADLLKEHIDRIDTVDFDAVKKQISGYDSSRDKVVATAITYDTLRSVSQTDLPVLALLPPPKDSEMYDRIVIIAKASNRKIINIELTAPLETLTSRYPDWLRLHQALQESGNKVNLRTLDEFKQAVQAPYFRPDDTHTFDSSSLSPNEIFEQVKAYLTS